MTVLTLKGTPSDKYTPRSRVYPHSRTSPHSRMLSHEDGTSPTKTGQVPKWVQAASHKGRWQK
ncbi:MAG: hypothetical protein WBM44_28135 [Waterburya sp.]